MLSTDANNVSGQVKALCGALVVMVRRRLNELKRCSQPRILIHNQARLLNAGGAVKGGVTDLAPSFAIFVTTQAVRGNEVKRCAPLPGKHRTGRAAPTPGQ